MIILWNALLFVFISFGLFFNNFELSDTKKLITQEIFRMATKEMPKEILEEKTKAPTNKKSKKITKKVLPKPPEKIVALTFDDGPSKSTPEIIKILKAKNMPATFFVVGNQIPYQENIIRLIHKSGMSLGSHTYSHSPNIVFSAKKIKKDFEQMNTLFEEIIGEKPKFFRPPYGIISKKTMSNIPVPIIQWSIDFRDWEGPKTKATIDAVLKKQLTPGGIILMHDLKPSSLGNLDKVLSYLEKEKYRVVPLDEIIKMYDKKFSSPNHIYSQGQHRYIHKFLE